MILKHCAEESYVNDSWIVWRVNSLWIKLT